MFLITGADLDCKSIPALIRLQIDDFHERDLHIRCRSQSQGISAVHRKSFSPRFLFFSHPLSFHSLQMFQRRFSSYASRLVTSTWSPRLLKISPVIVAFGAFTAQALSEIKN